MNNEEKILEILTQMKNQLNNLENKVDFNHNEVMQNINEVKDQIIELEGTNAANHVSINSRLNKVSDDLDFLTHKEFQTEKEIFNLRKRLPKQKRNLK